MRKAIHRGLALLIGAALIAVAAYGLAWLIDAMQRYDPKYYEPKDLERERHDAQRGREAPRQLLKP